MTSLIKSSLQLARCSSGSVLVETAIVLPVAISLMIGSVDFGMAFTTWATGNKSIRDAARYLGSLPPSIMRDAAGAWVRCPSWAVTNAKNLAVYGTIDVSGSPPPLVANWQVSGGSNNNVTVDCSTPSIVVTAKFPYNPLMLASFVPLASTVTLSAQHTEQSVGG
jgi:Flp pilus assembly protein TadG